MIHLLLSGEVPEVRSVVPVQARVSWAQSHLGGPAGTGGYRKEPIQAVLKGGPLDHQATDLGIDCGPGCEPEAGN
jgi:hypothetical protein